MARSGISKSVCGALLVLTLGTWGCTGSIGDQGAGASTGDVAEWLDEANPNRPGAGGSAGAAGEEGPMDGPADEEPGSPGATTELPAPATRVARLTHDQWENSVRDLFYLPSDTNFSDSFRADPKQGGFLFDNDATSLSVDEGLLNGYQRAAADVASLVTSDPALMTAILPADMGDPALRAAGFIRDFGLRAHRRPLSDEQATAYQTLFDMAPTMYEGMADFDAGVRLLIEAWLLSPHFLYRVEQSGTVEGEVIPLDSYEVASRMSYLLWNSMPDQALFAAAAADELISLDGVRAQANRLLGDARAEAVVQSFHGQLLEVEDFLDVAPAPAFFPNAPPLLGEHALRENELFVQHVVFGTDGNLADLLTSTDTFVNADLAAIYGLSGTYGTDFELASLDAAQRRGVFTQVGFLSSNATSVNPDPIHRGVFLARRISCLQIAAPPDSVPPVPPVPSDQTNRETIAGHTEQTGTICLNCHGPIINPFGFPFEAYDAIGGHRTTDNGHPVDTSASPLIDGMASPVADALELADNLAASTQVHECYAKHWIEFAYGRPEAAEDAALVERLATESVAGTASIKELIVGLVATQAFITRSTEELP